MRCEIKEPRCVPGGSTGQSKAEKVHALSSASSSRSAIGYFVKDDGNNLAKEIHKFKGMITWLFLIAHP